jgi:hypothetical protein
LLVWLGYDPPPGPGGDPAIMEAAGTAWAKRVSYDQFMAGLRATHNGPQPHLTALGHSYGSLTVGIAGQLPGGTHADDIILIGSPGSTAAHADQLGLPTSWKQRGYTVTQASTATGIPTAEADAPDGSHLSLDLERPGGVSFSATVGTIQGPAREMDVDSVYGRAVPPSMDSRGNTVLPTLKNDPYWSH